MTDQTPYCGNCGKMWTYDEQGKLVAPCDCASLWKSPREAMREIDQLERRANDAMDAILGIAKELKAGVEATVREHSPVAVPSRLGPHDPQRPGGNKRVVAKRRDGVQED